MSQRQRNNNRGSLSPKIDQLFASMKYYSPTKKTDQNHLIESIREIGKQILIEESKYDAGYNNQSLKIIEGPFLSPEISKQILRKPHQSKLVQPQKPKKSKNLYDKYKGQYNVQKERKLFNKTQQIARDIGINKPNLNTNYQHVTKRLYDKNIVNSLNYEKFINRKTQKEKDIDRSSKFTSFNNTTRQPLTFRSIQEESLTKRVDRNSAEKNIFQRGEQNRVLKDEKRFKMLAQKEQEEMAGLSFRPQKIAKQVRQGISKEERERVTSLRKQLKNKKILNQILEKSPFVPKVNHQEEIGSKIKSIWSSSLQILPKSKVRQESQHKQKSTKANSNSFSTSGLSLRNPSQLKFLFH